MFKLGQILPADSPLVDQVGIVDVQQTSVNTYQKDKDEKKAYAYENEDGTFVITGLLAIDREENKLLVAHPGGEREICKQECIFRVEGTLDLDETDLALFRRYYPHLK